MIKIRYTDLPQGLHAQVRTSGRPVIYLLPGLTPAQRRDALRRLVLTSRQGYGPRLRATGVAAAVARDVAKTTARNALAAVRCHPAGSALLAASVTAAVVCYALFVTVTVRFSPRPAGPPAAAGAAPFRPRDGRDPARSPGRASDPAATQPAVTVKLGASAGAGALGAGSRARRSGRPPTPGPVPTGTWSAPGGVLPSAPPGPTSPSPAPAPAPSPASPGSPPSHPGGLCLQLGPVGVCISG